MAHPLIERLARGPVLADGAMGTMLYASGASLDDSFDHLNLTIPVLCSSSTGRISPAGADIIETNTFGANRLKLETQGLSDKVREINKRAVMSSPAKSVRLAAARRSLRVRRLDDANSWSHTDWSPGSGS